MYMSTYGYKLTASKMKKQIEPSSVYLGHIFLAIINHVLKNIFFIPDNSNYITSDIIYRVEFSVKVSHFKPLCSQQWKYQWFRSIQFLYNLLCGISVLRPKNSFSWNEWQSKYAHSVAAVLNKNRLKLI